MKKNVLLMVPMLDQGGLERICALTAVLLKECCHVSVVVFNGENRIYDLEGVELIDLHLGSKAGKIRKIGNIIKRVRAAKRIKREKKIDITYSFGNTANIINVLSKQKDKVWIGIRGYGALAETKIMAFTCKRADKVICCTKVMEEEVKKNFKAKEVVTLYNPCDVGKIQQEAKEEITEHVDFFAGNEKIMAAMGRMNDIKGFWHVIKAFYLLQQRMPDTKLLFIGDQDSSEYERLVKDFGMEEKVLFLGVQKNPFCYLKYASAYVLTSSSEGFPNALVEAMAVGVPVLSVNCKTGPAEILSKDFESVRETNKVYEAEYGILLPTMNAVKNLDKEVIEEEERKLADEWETLFLSQERRMFYQEAGKKRAEFFSTEQYVKGLLREM